ncbi:MAG: nucleotidyl transferase AbiEii/AbiGii toxin family protein [Kiritimatiellae bacterium]|nr:nucleotidyl transferase AbiEii/AbiGii toxin family protein [Kiritimatiellia bacterium]
MIPENYLREWRESAPWRSLGMVEQDLIICRALVHIFADPLLARRLVFRGGTALHKLHLAPPSRYSEDIDLVQIESGPIGPIFDAFRESVGPFLGEARRQQGRGLIRLTYRVAPTDATAAPIRLKVEINSREHFAALPAVRRPFTVRSRWFSASCDIVTFRLEELLGSKLRALYQRRKGRDLFDLWLGLTRGKADPSLMVQCFHKFMDAFGSRVTGRQFRMSMEEKLSHPDFVHDTDDLLRSDVTFDIPAAYALLDREVLALL